MRGRFRPAFRTFLAGALLLALAAGAFESSGEGNGVNPKSSLTAPSAAAAASTGRSLFLKNCAHCHGDDARGDEGPDLHRMRHSDEWLARRIRDGVKGEMPAFGEKFAAEDVASLVAFLRSLR